MSYTYTTAHARSRVDPSKLDEVDISAMDLNVVFTTFSEIYLTLHHVPTNAPVYADMNALRDLMGVDARPRTIVSWLAANGNAVLPTIVKLPDRTPKKAYYNEAFRAGYNVRPVNMRRHPDSAIPPSERDDLLLSKTGVDFQQHWRHCLVTVNGMYHRVGGGADGLYVIDGNKSARIANRNMIGLHSFREVGALRIVPITPSMVYKTNENQSMRNYAYVRSPVALENKTVFLVLGGYLHAQDSLYRILNNHSLRIDFNNLLFPERIYDSMDRLDLSTLQLTGTDGNPLQFSMDELYSDERILAYLTLSQSFLIVIDSPHVYTRRHPVENCQLPGRYLTHLPMERFPLFGALGRCYDYTWFPKDDRVLLATEENQRHHYNFLTGPWKSQPSIDQTRYSADPWSFADGYMLEIGRV